MDSTSRIKVCKDSSSKRLACSLRRVARTLRTVLMCLSQTPPMWLAAGGLNLQSICCRRSFSVISSWFISLIATRSSLSAPTTNTVVASYFSYRSTTGNETAKCVREAVCFERVCDLKVNSSANKARQQCFVPFVFLFTLFRCKWTKIIYTNVRQRRRCCQSILWQVSHLLVLRRGFDSTAYDTRWDKLAHCGASSDYPILCGARWAWLAHPPSFVAFAPWEQPSLACTQRRLSLYGISQRNAVVTLIR